MSKLPRSRRRKNGKPAPQPELKTPPPREPEPRKPHPADELDALLEGPEEGAFVRGLDDRVVVYPTLVEEVTKAGNRILRVLSEHDLYDLWSHYENREFELGWVRERAAYELGWQHGLAAGQADVLRSQAPGQSEPVKRVGDQVRALVVNANLTPHEAANLLIEAVWAILNARPAPPYDG